MRCGLTTDSKGVSINYIFFYFCSYLQSLLSLATSYPFSFFSLIDLGFVRASAVA